MRPPYRTDLPICQYRDRILDALRSHRVVVLTGATGSGKSTQLPLLCLEAGGGRRGRIGITQPRRIAAVSLAEFVARQFGQAAGATVGYATRFNRRVGRSTRVKYMTDGVLLAEVRTDRLLRQYDTLIIDEAHERSLNIDVLLGYLRRLAGQRRDLQVVISSATIDAALFARAFDNAPVIDVPGKLFPVEVVYTPTDAEDPAQSYVDDAVVAASNICDMGDAGDILVFMPTERDILETAAQLEGKIADGADVLPLFSRLTHAQQARIFRPGGRRRIIVSTNVAETSLTVPGIRFVVDTGLARVKRFSPSQRITRLPVEPVSRASADQRKGRCGRLAEGMCVRLYSEEDFLSRPEFGQPEIQRCNLSDVILKMAAYGLGKIEEFPFIEAPAPRAVNDGYAHLRELSAIDGSGSITARGRRMADLPIDPHIAAMLLAARDLHALREVAVIAAGLSIVDPRERPAARRDDADLRQRRFVDPASDFLTLLRLWDAYHDEWGRLKTQNRMRAYCVEHYLSFNRMREWFDVHEQILHALDGPGAARPKARPATGEAIHRAILHGLISSIARRTDEGTYRTARGREAVIFPGSGLAKKQPAWIVCNEYVETSRLFARTVAEVNPLWIEETAPHLCHRQHGDPFFDDEHGFVRAYERVTIFGLPLVERRLVHYGRVAPAHAREIFVREGLIEGRLRTHHGFLRHNQSLVDEISTMENKLRRRDLLVDDEELFRTYDARLPADVASVHDLNRCVKERGSDRFLRLSREDLAAQPLPDAAGGFPDAISVQGKSIPLVYAFDPTSDRDGVTIVAPAGEAAFFGEMQLGWVVQPLWKEKAAALLVTLPRELRRQCMPLEETAEEIARRLRVVDRPFEQEVARLTREIRGVELRAEDFRTDALPGHLKMHLSITGASVEARPDRSSTDHRRDPPHSHSPAWGRRTVTAWDFGDLPDRIPLSEGTLPIFGYPALQARDNGAVDLALCGDPDEAALTHERGVRCLAGIVLEQDLGWLERQLKFPQSLRLLCAPAGGEAMWRALLLRLVRDHALDPGPKTPRGEDDFRAYVNRAREFLATAAQRNLVLLEDVLAAHHRAHRLLTQRALSLGKELRSELAAEIARLMDALGGPCADLSMLRNMPRYFTALGFRIERASTGAGYRAKAAALEKYRALIRPCAAAVAGLPAHEQRLIRDAAAMVEEYAISLFAQQEVKTLFPVSEKRLDARIALLPRPRKA